MDERILKLKREIGKAIIGKEEIVEKILAAILAGGNILLEDIPGVGKTTLALACAKSMGLQFRRVQFTPDVVPSDITGFSMYDKQTGSFVYSPGTVMCQFFLADEINRTSSKTQSALLEVMQEGKVTVDGQTHSVPSPFIVMATQNPIGTVGTQMLPEAQLDRFMIQLSMGYPSFQEQVEILMKQEREGLIETVEQVIDAEELSNMIVEVTKVYMDEKICRYITSLVEATRNHPDIRLGVSPRGAIALYGIAQAEAFLQGREFVIPEDVDRYFADVCRHRILMHSKARSQEKSKEIILQELLQSIQAPK